MDLVSVELGGLNRGVNEHEFGFAVDMTANGRVCCAEFDAVEQHSQEVLELSSLTLL